MVCSIEGDRRLLARYPYPTVYVADSEGLGPRDVVEALQTLALVPALDCELQQYFDKRRSDYEMVMQSVRPGR